tara:strand:- start:12791 stop:13069 length:279 start_codon:yes stop_codon:yes gene_type:complete
MNSRNNKSNNFSGFITVHSSECGGNSERMIRKFIKKVKRGGILEEVKDRRYYKSGSVLNAERKRNKKSLVQKINKKREELLTTTKTRAKRRS